jgi:hypothetical protein
MRRDFLIGIPVVVAAIALGVAAAFGASRLIDNSTTGSGNGSISSPQRTTNLPAIPQQNGRGNGNSGGPNNRSMPGMMWQRNQGYNQQQTGQRITLDQATQAAQDYAAQVGTNLTVADVLEFQNGFYAIVTEKDTGRGAFELLIDPYTGNVSLATGPDMMWDFKYGRMQTSNSADNTVTLGQAQADAQKALDAQVPGAKLGNDAYNFYGYYTFNYQVNGQTAGLLSVNGINGQVWLDTRLGSFISEKEVGK